MIHVQLNNFYSLFLHSHAFYYQDLVQHPQFFIQNSHPLVTSYGVLSYVTICRLRSLSVDSPVSP